MSSTIITTEKPNRPLRRSWLRQWQTWLIVLAIVCGFLGWLGWRHWQEQKELQAVLDQWDQQGAWRWKDWLAARPTPPEEENGAQLLDRMVQLKPKNLDTELSDALLFDESHMYPRELLHPEQVLELRSRLTRCKEMLALFPELSGKKIFVWSIPAGISPLASPMNIQDVRSLLNILLDQFNVHLHDREIKAACEDIRNGLELVRTMDNQLSMIGRLVSIALVQQWCQSIQRLLALSEPEDALLMQLQAELARFDEQRSWKKAVFTETGWMNQTIEDMQQGKIDINRLKGVAFLGSGSSAPGSWWDKWKDKIVSYFENRAMLSALQQAECLQFMLAGYQQAEQPWSTQRQYWSRYTAQCNQETANGNKRLKHLLLPMMIKCVEAEMKFAATLRTTQVALAAERFRLKEKRWPTSQTELVGRYLHAIQVDPYDDQPLRMKRTDDGLVIYSIGWNDQDDEGSVLPTETSNRPLDTGVRLWDVTQRRQPARPLSEYYLKLKEESKQKTEEKKE